MRSLWKPRMWLLCVKTGQTSGRNCCRSQSWWPCRCHSNSTQTCRKYNRFHTTSTISTANTRELCKSQWVSSPCEGPTPWQINNHARSCTDQSWKTWRPIWMRLFRKRSCDSLDLRAPRRLQNRKLEIKTVYIFVWQNTGCPNKFWKKIWTLLFFVKLMGVLHCLARM